MILKLLRYIVPMLVAMTVCSVSEAAELYDKIAIYGEAKYKKLNHFNYVNPDAPKGGRIVMPNYGGFDNFNPFIFKGIAPSSVPNLTLDTLGVVPVDDFSTVYPLIAKQFELPKDRSYVGFIIDERAKFSDGTPITADDVIFSFNALIEKGAPIYRMYYMDIEKAVKVSDRHVRFMFKKGIRNKELPLIVAQLSVFSAKDWEGKDFSQPKLEAYLGSGPYKLDRFSAGKFLIFKRRDDYWAKDLPTRRGFFNFDEIRFDYYQDTTVTLQALFSGNIDVREEYIAKIWVTGYDNEIVKSGRIVKEAIEHNNPAILQFFGFNIRKDKFKDKRVREAIGLAFNFNWANENLFYNQYDRLYSYFTNTEMAATDLPTGLELKILNKHRKDLPESVFTTPFENPEHKDYMVTREYLRQAVSLLKEAGYDFKDGKMINVETGEPLSFEVLSNTANGSAFTRVMLPFIENLRKIGVECKFRNLEVNIFKNRLDNFDFDMAILSYRMSSMPGNEQREFWGSQSADIKGSYNIIGIKNPVADKLIQGLIEADRRNEYVAYVKALDRVLLHEHYLIFQWYSAYNRVAYWDKFGMMKDTGVGFLVDTWWAENKK